MQESEGVLCMRVSFRIALAGQVIGVSALYEQTRTFCKNYLTDAPASFEVAVTPADIAFEREKNDREAAVEGHAPGNFSDEYLETLALYRKIVERLLEWDTLLFHGSCISVDSKAYLFTAKSGTGKSTHTQLWKKRFGERAVFINDDKPLLKISAQGVTVYGTPWDGKHHRSTNTSCPLKAVCILTRNTENSIQRIDKKAASIMINAAVALLRTMPAKPPFASTITCSPSISCVTKVSFSFISCRPFFYTKRRQAAKNCLPLN